MHKFEFYLFYKKENELFEMYNYIRVMITAILILLHVESFVSNIPSPGPGYKVIII